MSMNGPPVNPDEQEYGLNEERRAVNDAACQAQERDGLTGVALSKGQPDRDGCDVIGTLFFGSKVLKTDIGSVSVALTAGQFYFRPSNARIDYGSVAASIRGTLPLHRQISGTQTSGHSGASKDRAVAEMEVTAKLAPEAKAKLQGEVEQTRSDTGSITLTATVEHSTFSATPYQGTGLKVDVRAPPGIDGRPEPLRGSLYDDHLFSVSRLGVGAVDVSVTFQVQPGSLRALEGTGAWELDGVEITKRRLIERLTAKLVEGNEWGLGEFSLLPKTGDGV